MELISVGFLQNSVMHQYGKYPELRVKIDRYFTNFADNYVDFNYVWFEDRMYVEAKHGELIKGDIENVLNRRIDPFGVKIFPPESFIRFIDCNSVKQKIEEKKQKKIKEREEKKQKIRDDFNAAVRNIKNKVEGHRFIGSFDLEFWEINNNIILEFGWRVEDYVTGIGNTVHLVIQENLEYNNTMFSKSNRFARKDCEVVTLSSAKERFKKEFLDVVEVLVGHGASNDVKVLKVNGVLIGKNHIDTSVIGGMLMNRSSMVSLTNLVRHYRIKHGELHNAANDAECIMRVFFEMGELNI